MRRVEGKGREVKGRGEKHLFNERGKGRVNEKWKGKGKGKGEVEGEGRKVASLRERGVGISTFRGREKGGRRTMEKENVFF